MPLLLSSADLCPSNCRNHPPSLREHSKETPAAKCVVKPFWKSAALFLSGAAAASVPWGIAFGLSRMSRTVMHMYEITITDWLWRSAIEGLAEIRLGNEARGVELIERGLTEDVFWAVGELDEAQIMNTIGFSAAVEYNNITGAVIVSRLLESEDGTGTELTPIPEGSLRAALHRLQNQHE